MQSPEPQNLSTFMAGCAVQAIAVQRVLDAGNAASVTPAPRMRIVDFNFKVDAALTIDRSRGFTVGAAVLNLTWRVMHSIRTASDATFRLQVMQLPAPFEKLEEKNT